MTRRATTPPSWCARRSPSWPSDDELLRQERERARWLFVDEYQDTDPAQVELLDLLAGGGGNLVAVGDPDQSIYAFRGAEPRGIVEFPDRFRHTDGRRAARVSLGVCRRSGEELLRITRRVAEGLPGPWEHRRLAAGERTDPGAAEVHVFASAAVEAAYLADVLRRAHLLDGLPWSQMAVVVRTATALGPLRRALASAGVPVAVSSDDLPLAAQPAVAPLLSALTALLPAPGAGREGEEPPVGLDEPAAEALLASPLGGATVLDLRRLRRAVRVELARRGIDAAERGAPLATAIEDDGLLESTPRAGLAPGAAGGRGARPPAGSRWPTAAPPRTCSGRCGSAAAWPRRWARASAAGGPTGAVADRDLDAVVALFDAAAGFVDRLPSADVRAFVAHLSAQELPGDTGAARAVAGESVRLLTAHASKGLEWDLVCVAGVQEGVWPDLRERTSLLGTEEMVERAAGIDATAVDRRTLALAEEQRLFYVACTRARRRLVVTAVEGALDSADAGCDGVPVPRPRRAAAGGRPCPHRPAAFAHAPGPGGRAAPRRHRSADAVRHGGRRPRRCSGGSPTRGCRARPRPSGGGSHRCPTTPRWCPTAPRCGCGRRRSRPSSAARCGGC